ncbi:septal ring lytic transglycosylase RlpA family protein [Roseateles amylovorans]|uniref:Endolytic peptidoglycan transglycosylase RlpA n=1 Tax=Roseateles amylovorans TaxID=2978473 RepID=A0ABY6B1P5_9BURK|nr:septal ring lytic transglycosylase RlpA family protein [Roseateles amylovorans]UXH78624.1 septal ring lytic transglycosylase RlpA family protein [Roseateles amylovorans]
MFEARPAGQRLAVLTCALFLAACASRGPAPKSPSPSPSGGPKVTQWPDKDGPEAQAPADLDKIPDALPRLESIRKGGPNKPYAVAGRSYQPIVDDQPLVERGLASWYGRKFHGRQTASGEVYNMYAMTAAHATMPIPSYARVRNPKNGREVIVRINDRGPFHPGRIVDLSYTAALKLDLLRGVGQVEVERITYEDIRTGAWTRGRELPASPPAQDTPVYAAASPSGAPSLPTTADARPPARELQDLSPAAASATPSPRGSSVAAAKPGTAAPTRTVPAAGPVTSVTAGGTSVATAAASTAGAGAGMVPLPVTALPAGTDLDTPASELPGALATAPTSGTPTASQARSPAADSAQVPRLQLAAAPGFWLQLGAFSRLEGAETLREQFNRELDWMAPMLAIFKDKSLHRLQAGPFISREDARAAAERVRTAMALTPVLVERR